MSETAVLRSNAIVTNASVGATKPPLVSAGPALPKVQVKPLPAGPQVQQGQQKPVVMLPPKDLKAAIMTGGLPMVQVKMTNTGPQIDDGRHNPVVINPPRGGLPKITAGGLPMVQVAMTKAGPQVQSVQTAPQVHTAPPRIHAAGPMLSQPRVARIAAPRAVAAPLPIHQVPQVQLPQLPVLTTDQMLLCRHLVDKYLGDLRAPAPSAPEAVSEIAEAPEVAETTANAEIIELAEQTILMIDRSLSIATATALAAEEAFAGPAAMTEPVVEAVAEEVSPMEGAAPEPAPAPAARSFVGYRVPPAFAPAGYARPATGISYAAPRVTGTTPQPRGGGGYRHQAPGMGYRQQRNAAMAPRRVPRAGAPLPPVIVKMENGKPQVQNQAAVAAARAAVAEARFAGAVTDPMPDMSALPVDITGTITGNDQQG